MNLILGRNEPYLFFGIKKGKSIVEKWLFQHEIDNSQKRQNLPHPKYKHPFDEV